MSDDTTDQKSAEQSESNAGTSTKSSGTILGDNAGVHIPSESKKSGPSRDVPADFGSFVVSLGTNCMIHLGQIPHPETQQTARDLASAKHTIDLLQMLREKTEGNLVDEEIKLINSLIYDLKSAYVQQKKAKN